MRKKIVITGAGGSVISRVIPELQKDYDLVLLVHNNIDSSGKPIEGVHAVDLVTTPREEYRQYFKGADIVIHTAYGFVTRRKSPNDSMDIRAPSLDDYRYGVALEDIGMTFNILRTALEEGLKRAIVFSSNHAADYYENLIKEGVLETITEDMVPYSNTFYGWSKICQEALGHMFAAGSDASGKQLEVIMIRFGAPRTDLIENVTSNSYYNLRRHFGSYMSVRDELQMLKLCIEKEDIRDANGVPFQLIYGTSNNLNRIWSLRNAKAFGYEPQDSSYTDFPERIKKLFTEAIDKEMERKGG